MLKEVNLNEKEGSKITWAKISNGLIVVNSDENDTKAKSRTNKLGNIVYERFYKSIYGIITTISVEENKFGETEVKVGLKHDEMIGVLSFNLESSYGRGFMSQIFNVDFSRGVEFTPWQKINEDGTKRTNLYLGYGKRESVKYALPEGTPEVKWVDTKKGKVVDPVSKAEHEDFLDIKLKELIQNNGLQYTKEISSTEFLESSELTAEEQSQLRKPKSKKITNEGVETIENGGLNDLFDGLN